MKFTFLTLLVLAACSFKKGLDNQTLKGHEELYSEPGSPTGPKVGHQKVVIAATNDMHAQFAPKLVTLTDDHNKEKQTIEIGGVDIISSYFKILREVNGEILLVDSGDIFGKRSAQMSAVKDYYDELEYDAITIGLRDFNLRVPSKFPNTTEFFKDFAKSSKTPLILGNLYDVKTGRVVEWQGTLPYLIREVNGVKIGIIGLVPDDIVKETPVDNRVGLYLESMLESTLRHARLLRSLGAEVIAVITHQGFNCGEKLAQETKLPLNKVNFEPTKSDLCDLNNKMGEFINRLPPNLVDVIVGGRNEKKIANFVNGTLVMSGFPDGQSFSYVEFYVDEKTRKVNKELTDVHQPVMFCREFFKESSDCYPEDSSIDHKERTPAEFLGRPVTPDAAIEQKFKKHLKEMTPVETSSVTPESLLNLHEADIAYKVGEGHSKLVLIELSGKELSSVLEEDFNQGKTSSWLPSPFSESDNGLSLSIGKNELNPSKKYKMLTDLEDLQKHPLLRKFITRIGSRTLVSHSWNASVEADDVSMAMAAPDSNTIR